MSRQPNDSGSGLGIEEILILLAIFAVGLWFMWDPIMKHLFALWWKITRMEGWILGKLHLVSGFDEAIRNESFHPTGWKDSRTWVFEEAKRYWVAGALGGLLGYVFWRMAKFNMLRYKGRDAYYGVKCQEAIQFADRRKKGISGYGHLERTLQEINGGTFASDDDKQRLLASLVVERAGRAWTGKFPDGLAAALQDMGADLKKCGELSKIHTTELTIAMALAWEVRQKRSIPFGRYAYLKDNPQTRPFWYALISFGAPRDENGVTSVGFGKVHDEGAGVVLRFLLERMYAETSQPLGTTGFELEVRQDRRQP